MRHKELVDEENKSIEMMIYNHIIQTHTYENHPYFITGAVVSLIRIFESLGYLIPEVVYNNQGLPIYIVIEHNGDQLVIRSAHGRVKADLVDLKSHNKKTKNASNLILKDLVPFRIDTSPNWNTTSLINGHVIFGDDCSGQFRAFETKWDTLMDQGYSSQMSFESIHFYELESFLKCKIISVNYSLYGESSGYRWIAPKYFKLYRDEMILDEKTHLTQTSKLDPPQSPEHLINIPVVAYFRGYIQCEREINLVNKYNKTHTTPLGERTFNPKKIDVY